MLNCINNALLGKGGGEGSVCPSSSRFEEEAMSLSVFTTVFEHFFVASFVVSIRLRVSFTAISVVLCRRFMAMSPVGISP